MLFIRARAPRTASFAPFRHVRRSSTNVGICPHYSGLLTLSASSSAASGSDHGRLNMALRLIEQRGRLYVSLLGKYDYDAHEPTPLKTILSRIHSIYHQSALLRPDVDVRVPIPDAQSTAAPVCMAPELGTYIGHPHDEAAALAELNAGREAGGVAPVSFQPCIMPTMPSMEHMADQGARPAGRQMTGRRCHNSAPWWWAVRSTGSTRATSYLLMAVGLVASRSVAIGVTGEQLLRNKTAGFLIEPCDVRKVLVSRFMESVKPSLHVTTSTITDPVGVAGSKEGLNCIVVSDETAAGGHYCNRLRVANGLAPMEVVVVPTVDAEASAPPSGGACAAPADGNGRGWDDKISSTSLRLAELGRFRGDEREFGRRTPPSLPYVIGIAGGIASGKSTVMRALARMAGAATIDADQVAHLAYEPGTECFEQVVAAFGDGVVGGDGRTLPEPVGRDHLRRRRHPRRRWRRAAAAARAHRVAGGRAAPHARARGAQAGGARDGRDGGGRAP